MVRRNEDGSMFIGEVVEEVKAETETGIIGDQFLEETPEETNAEIVEEVPTEAPVVKEPTPKPKTSTQRKAPGKGKRK